MMMKARHLFPASSGKAKPPREKSPTGGRSLVDVGGEVVVARIARLPLFEGCSSRLPEILRSLHSKVRKYTADEIVVAECDKASSVLVVLSGRVKVTECGLEEDARHLVGCLSAGETFGATLPALDLATYPGLVEAKDRSEILFLDVSVIRAWLSFGTEPRFLANLYAAASRQGFRAWRKCALLSCYEISDRLALYLRALKEEDRPIPTKFDIPLLAETLGVNRTALYRAMGKADCRSCDNARRLKVI